VVNLLSRQIESNNLELSFSSDQAIFKVKNLSVKYDAKIAIQDIDLEIPKNKITAIIGPSGCGKSTLIRAFNRMNELIPGCTQNGEVIYHQKNIYDPSINPVNIRRRIGMVFQKPNPFPKSIFENVAFGAKINHFQGDLNDLVEYCLKKAALWDEVKDKLSESAYSLSGGQQQRLCIARVLAVSPDVILMDEPASALDPIATSKIEELMWELKENYSIIIVTHNMQQASRVSDYTAFMNIDLNIPEARIGHLVEFEETSTLFVRPKNKETEDYISGKFG
jgi:phosphate transport system ATP-binding protein